MFLDTRYSLHARSCGQIQSWPQPGQPRPVQTNGSPKNKASGMQMQSLCDPCFEIGLQTAGQPKLQAKMPPQPSSKGLAASSSSHNTSARAPRLAASGQAMNCLSHGRSIFFLLFLTGKHRKDQLYPPSMDPCEERLAEELLYCLLGKSKLFFAKKAGARRIQPEPAASQPPTRLYIRLGTSTNG